jgi:hypothetical protein
MYKFIKLVDVERYRAMLAGATWKQVLSSDRHFYTNMIRFPNCSIAFFLKIPPGGKVHRHIDTTRIEKTFHIPIETNDDCWNYTYHPDSKIHMDIGHVYEINRQIEHESFNNGKTDRIHLILESNELPV